MNIEDLVHFLLPLYVEVWIILPLELWNLNWWRLSLWENDGGVVRDRHMVFIAVDGIMPKTFKEISD